MFNEFNKKESPILGMLGMGGGIARAGGDSAIEASGGTTTTFGSYKAHIFELGTSDNFVVTAGSGNIDLLVVGGGGAGCGGGSGKSGGGGAGAVIHETGFSVSPGTYPITVGAGGAPAGRPGTDGGNSSFSSTHIARGGGGGGGTVAGAG
jgi:hypothetical protein